MNEISGQYRTYNRHNKVFTHVLYSYVLYWSDDGQPAAETSSSNHELILLLYHCVDILSCVVDSNASIQGYS